MPVPAILVTHQFAGLGEVDSWDPHRARSTFVQRVHSLTYHRIVRWERSGSLPWSFFEADLCGLPEILDLETWSFNVDPRARFWFDEDGEGRPVTSEDVRLSIERLSSVDGRWEATDEDPRRPADWTAIRFEAAAPFADWQAPFRLRFEGRHMHSPVDVIAAPFSWIASAEAIDQAGSRWPYGSEGDAWTDGSGAYRLHRHGPAQTALVRAKRWWAAQPAPRRSYPLAADRLARIDAIRMFAGSADELMQMYAASDIDVAGSPLDNAQIDALAAEFPEHETYEVIGGRPLQLVTPRDPDPAGPLSDPRIVTAINWSVNRARIEHWSDGPAQLRASGPVAPQFAWLALPDDELRGYFGYHWPTPETRDAVAHLVEAAGGAEHIAPLKLVVLDEVARALPGLGGLVLRMGRQTSGLAIELVQAGRADAKQRLRDGERFAFLRWGETPKSTLPVRDWLHNRHTDGPAAWGAFADPVLDRSLDELRTLLNSEDLSDAVLNLQRRWLSGSATGWIHDLAVPVQRVIVQPWFSPDPRWLDFAWSDQYLVDCDIRLRDRSGYPAARRTLPGSNSNTEGL